MERERKLPDDMDEDYCRNLVKLIRVGDDNAAVYLLRMGLETAFSAGWAAATKLHNDEIVATVEAVIRHNNNERSN
jgi:hypothetical protein